MSGSLRPRLLGAGAALALIVAAGFAVLLVAVRGLEHTGDRARHSEQVIAAANRLEKLVLDLETGERGYVITHRPEFLAPYTSARRAFPGQGRKLERLVADNPAQEARAQAIVRAGEEYLTHWAIPLVRTAERNPEAARAQVANAGGKRRVDAIRKRFAAFGTAEQKLGDTRRHSAATSAHWAILLGAIGVLGSILLIALFIAYLLRTVLQPVRRVADAAGLLARGDLSTRVPTEGSGEPAVLGRAFNTMASTLQEGRDELESQNAELEVQAAELEDQREQLATANDELEQQQSELEQTVAQLDDEKQRVEAFYAFGERLAAETDPDALGEIALSGLADFAHAEVGTLYALDNERSAQRLAATRGLVAARLPDLLEPGSGLAGRALAERRRIVASHGETGLRVSALGDEVALRHEIHVPLIRGDQTVGVVTLGRLADLPFTDEDAEAIEHLAAQAAVALATAAFFRDVVRQAGINRAVLESSADGIAMLDLESRIVLANAEMERLVSEAIGEPARLVEVGRSREEIAATMAERTLDPDAYRAGLAAALADVEAELEDEYEIRATGRAYKRYSAPVRDADGRLLGRIITVRDVTREREAERLKTELVATVSHELRTPLTGILGFAELLLRQKPGEEPRRQYVETIHAEAQRLTVLINDFLDLQRIERGGFTLALEPFDLIDVVRDEYAAASGQSARHDLELEVPEEPIVVAGDPERVRQVIGNLVSNAIKYSPAGGRVELRAVAADSTVRVSVTDSGIGIPADQQQQIFTQFFRVDSSDTRKIGGTGLGLALCREIVVAHGGRIGFDSAEGEGSTFWFELPLGLRGHGSKPTRILVIEDDASTAALLSETLAQDGYVIETARDGEQGLARALAEPPAAICLDICLEGPIDGWTILGRLKANPATSAVPVIVCTAGDGRDSAAALGAADFVAKPFDPADLRAAVARLLPPGRGDVLIVDDDASVRRLVVEALAQKGRVLREAADGEEALTAIADSRPDAIVLDLLMPGIDGFEVLERLQSDPSTRWLPVVVLTARRLSARERRALQSRALALLDKATYSPDELRRLVELAVAE